MLTISAAPPTGTMGIVQPVTGSVCIALAGAEQVPEGRAFAQHVKVSDDAIYIKGSKNTLLRTLVAAKGGKMARTGTPGFIPKWRMGWV